MISNHQHLPANRPLNPSIDIVLRCVRTLRQAVEWGARPIDLAHDYNWLGAKGSGHGTWYYDSKLDSIIIPLSNHIRW